MIGLPYKDVFKSSLIQCGGL